MVAVPGCDAVCRSLGLGNVIKHCAVCVDLCARTSHTGVGGDAPEGAAQTSKLWVGFGLLWGLLALSNSSLLSFLPFCVVWMVWRDIRGHAGRAVRNMTIAALCCGATVKSVGNTKLGYV
jgi:hypothetical protein